MDLFSDIDKAYSCAIRRFYRQKSDEPVCIYRVNVARREMWAVLSAAEAKANKVSASSSYTAVDGRYGLADFKKKLQEQREKHPEIPYLIRYANGVRQKLRAERQLEKMKRGRGCAERQTELDTTEA